MLFLGNRIFGGIPKYKRVHFVVSKLSDAQKLINFCTTGNTKNFAFIYHVNDCYCKCGHYHFYFEFKRWLDECEIEQITGVSSLYFDEVKGSLKNLISYFIKGDRATELTVSPDDLITDLDVYKFY